MAEARRAAASQTSRTNRQPGSPAMPFARRVLTSPAPRYAATGAPGTATTDVDARGTRPRRTAT